MSDPTIQVLPKGPYLVTGKITLLDASGNKIEAGEKIASAVAALPSTNHSATGRIPRSDSTRPPQPSQKRRIATGSSTGGKRRI